MARREIRQVNRNNYTRANYMYGNTAVRPDFEKPFEETRRRTVSNEVRKNREKAKYMSLGYIAFLLVAFSIAAVVLIGYIQLNSDITTLTEEIAKQEKILNDMRIANSEAMSRVESSIDLSEVKRVALQELGMIYPSEGQIINYEGATYDYVRKVADTN